MKMKQLTEKMCLEVGILIALLMLIGGYIFNYEKGFLYSGICLLISLVWPRFWNPLAILWFYIGEVLGKVFSSILLSAIFFFMVTPVGLFRRAFGKDSMKLKAFKSDSSSHFLPVNKIIVPKDLIYQF